MSVSLYRDLRKVRRSMYRGARVLGDVDAVLSGSPKRVVKRYGNKAIGRKVVRRMWLR